MTQLNMFTSHEISILKDFIEKEPDSSFNDNFLETIKALEKGEIKRCLICNQEMIGFHPSRTICSFYCESIYDSNLQAIERKKTRHLEKCDNCVSFNGSDFCLTFHHKTHKNRCSCNDWDGKKKLNPWLGFGDY